MSNPTKMGVKSSSGVGLALKSCGCMRIGGNMWTKKEFTFTDHLQLHSIQVYAPVSAPALLCICSCSSLYLSTVFWGIFANSLTTVLSQNLKVQCHAGHGSLGHEKEPMAMVRNMNVALAVEA